MCDAVVVLQYLRYEKIKRRILFSDISIYSSDAIANSEILKMYSLFVQSISILIFVQCQQCHHVNCFALFVCVESTQDNHITLITAVQDYPHAL